MKVMFIVHRMHPNLMEVHHALVSFGHECVFITASIGPSEPESFDDRILVDQRSLSERAVQDLLEQHEPDLLIQRKIDGTFLQFWTQARNRDLARVLYTQDPHQVPLADVVIRPARVVRLARDLLLQRMVLGPHIRITPVKFWGRPGSMAFSHSVYVPFPARVWAPQQTALSNPPTVVTVAKHGQKRKRIRWLIKALRQAKEPFRLVIAGSSPMPHDRSRQKNYSHLRHSVLTLGDSANKVEILENLGREDMKSVYLASDIFALPSKRELMAISPLEAMSHGLPVLVGSDGGAASYVSPSGSEQIFRARSYRDFRRKLFVLLENHRLRRSLSGRVLNQVGTAHNPKLFVDQLVHIAHSLNP